MSVHRRVEIERSLVDDVAGAWSLGDRLRDDTSDLDDGLRINDGLRGNDSGVSDVLRSNSASVSDGMRGNSTSVSDVLSSNTRVDGRNNIRGRHDSLWVHEG